MRLTKADNCTVVVMQPGTGKILALAQYPGYQPSDVTNLAATQDLPVSAVFPPGSTAKVITAAAALERGQTPMTPYTVPEQIAWAGSPSTTPTRTRPSGSPWPASWRTPATWAWSRSPSTISPQVQYQYFRAFGIGVPTGLPLPGSSNGLLAPPSQWWGDQRYTLAFGQGVASTAVQMASLYATIANGGVRVPPTIVAGTTAADGRFVPAPRPRGHRVLQAATAA